MKKLSTLIAIVVICGLTAIAQKSDAPGVRLNAEASKAFAQLNQRQAELRREYEQLEVNKLALLIGAGVPADQRDCAADAAGIVVCSKPKPTAAPPTNPTPK